MQDGVHGGVDGFEPKNRSHTHDQGRNRGWEDGDFFERIHVMQVGVFRVFVQSVQAATSVSTPFSKTQLCGPAERSLLAVIFGTVLFAPEKKRQEISSTLLSNR